MKPVEDLAGALDAHRRLLVTVAALTKAQARRPSLLPGWTVAHTLTHIARNADSHTLMFEGAARGEVWDQYPGGAEQRAADIEAGAASSSSDLADDVRTSIGRLEAAWASTTDAVWAAGKGRTFGGETPLAELVFRRWREVEVHHHDLGLAFTWKAWSHEYALREIEASVRNLGRRLVDGPLALRSTDSDHIWTVPDSVCSLVEVRAPRRQLAAWLMGRYEDPYYPSLKPWM